MQQRNYIVKDEQASASAVRIFTGKGFVANECQLDKNEALVVVVHREDIGNHQVINALRLAAASYLQSKEEDPEKAKDIKNFFPEAKKLSTYLSSTGGQPYGRNKKAYSLIIENKTELLVHVLNQLGKYNVIPQEELKQAALDLIIPQEGKFVRLVKKNSEAEVLIGNDLAFHI